MAPKKKKPVKKKTPTKKERIISKRVLGKVRAKKIFKGDAVERSQDVYTKLVHNYMITMLAGQPVSYTPSELFAKAAEYFTYLNKHPLVEEKVFGSGRRMTVKHIRAATMMGFCVFACMDRTTFDAYKKDDKYSYVCKVIENAIYMQKFEGAAADLLNHAIIARDLGLVDKQSLVDNNGDAIITGFNYIVPDKPKDDDDQEH